MCSCLKQIEMLVDGIKQYAPGCFSTPENLNAWMRDSSWGESVWWNGLVIISGSGPIVVILPIGSSATAPSGGGGYKSMNKFFLSNELHLLS